MTVKVLFFLCVCVLYLSFLYCQTLLPTVPTTAQLNPLHSFIFSYIEKVSIQSIFFLPRFNMYFYGDRP